MDVAVNLLLSIIGVVLLVVAVDALGRAIVGRSRKR